MGLDGKYTSLELNVYSGLLANTGFTINPNSVKYQGTWTPTEVVQGEFVLNTTLNHITQARKNFLTNCVGTKLDINTWRRLLSIGENSCPALSNSKPKTYVPTYPGYGTWEYKGVDQYGNAVESTELTMTENVYPHRDYGISTDTSYIHKTYGSYAWLSAWPGKNSWQKDTDDFAAVVAPSATETSITDYDRYFSDGFVSLVARQAYYEFWSDKNTRRPNQYKEFIRYITMVHQWKQGANVDIGTFENSKTFLKGSFSGINDLTTSDISGVSLAFKDFGSELINLGKALDLSHIDVFGLPSKLLLTLEKNNAVTEAVKLALLLVELSITDIQDILSGSLVPAPWQEKKIYDAMMLVRNEDLADIKIILNCATLGLETLADLVNPMKMFPATYKTLTIPAYDVNTPSNKNYDFIYNGQNVNPLIHNWGTYLVSILPDDLAIACGAFMMTMNQIKNIKQIEFEKFAQVVANLEVTNKGLDLVDSADGTPTNVTMAQAALSRIAHGSGSAKTFRLVDFLGAMSGVPYNILYQKLMSEFSKFDTSELDVIYKKLHQKSLGNDWELLLSSNIADSTRLFINLSTTKAGVTVIPTMPGVNRTLQVNDVIFFSKSDVVSDASHYDKYTVVSVSGDGITITPALKSVLEYGNKIFRQSTEYDTYVSTLVDSADTIIEKFAVNYRDVISNVNSYWDKIGRQLATEQTAIPLACKQSLNVSESATPAEIEAFVKLLSNYAMETNEGEIAQVLENISDLNTLSGQSIVAVLRESRNAARIINMGGNVDTGIPHELPTNIASAVAVVEGTKIKEVIVTSPGHGYTTAPNVMIHPQGGVFGHSGAGAVLKAVLDDTSGVKAIEVVDGGYGYNDNPVPDVLIGSPPKPDRIGGPIVPGSLSGSPYVDQDPVPDNLIALPSASFDVPNAIIEVDRCKCNC